MIQTRGLKNVKMFQTEEIFSIIPTLNSGESFNNHMVMKLCLLINGSDIYYQWLVLLEELNLDNISALNFDTF